MAWQDAVTAVVKDQSAVVAEYDKVVRSPSRRDAAAVGRRDARLRADAEPGGVHAVQRVPARPIPLPVLRRRNFHASQLTFEHVVPRSRGGVTAWDNIVAACDRAI